FYDEDNDPLNYSYYNNLNVHINISFGFVTFSFRENWYGEEKIIFNASDGEYFVQQEVFVEVLPLNDPPILNLKELNATEDIEYSIDLSPYIIDVDNKSSDVHMSAVSKYIKSIIGFNITFLYPNGILNDTIEIILTDGIDTTILYVYISIMPVNDPPILNLKELNATEDIEGLIDLSPYIIDVDNKSSEINMSAVSRYIKSVIGFNITFLYPNGILNDTIEITLTDGINITAWYIYVSIMPVNDPPFLEFMENITVKEGDVVIIEPIAHDEDTKELIINISGAMNSKKWRTKEGDAGVHKVTIAVSDGEYIVEQELFIFVLNVNTAPIPKCKYRKEGREVFFDGSESYDLDNDTLKFEWEFGDGNKGYGKNIVHKYLKDGKYKVVLTVSDGNLTTSTYILVKIEKKAIPGFTILMALIVIAFISRSSYISSHLPFLYLLN
ncbi:MAG: PKD domain-containing protein, partial [Candidatus Thermoplasmatota archaeon]